MKSLEQAANDYLVSRSDTDFNQIYNFVIKCSGIISRKMNIPYNEDVTQDAAARVFKYIDKYNSKYPFYNWAYTTVLNSMRRYFMNEKRYFYGVDLEGNSYDKEDRVPYQALYEEPDYFQDDGDNLTDEDCAEAIEKFKPGKLFYGNRKIDIPEEQYKQIYLRHITEEKNCLDLSKEFGYTHKQIQSIIKRYRAGLIAYIKERYKHKIIPEQQTTRMNHYPPKNK